MFGKARALKSLFRGVRGWLRHIVVHDARVIIAAPVNPDVGLVDAVDEAIEECVIIESSAELEALAGEIPSGFSAAKLRKATAQGSFLVCIRRSVAAGKKQIVAYRICERGVFSSPGIRKRISPEFVFVQYAEVLPEYRGKRVARKLKQYLHKYAHARNIRWTCGAVSVTNAASLAAHLRAQEGSEPEVIGSIDSLRFFGGRPIVLTPWWRIRRRLDALSKRQVDALPR